MSIAKPGRMIMGPGAFTNSRHSYTVSAITDVRACFISFEVFRSLVKSNGSFAEGTDRGYQRKITENTMQKW